MRPTASSTTTSTKSDTNSPKTSTVAAPPKAGVLPGAPPPDSSSSPVVSSSPPAATPKPESTTLDKFQHPAFKVPCITEHKHLGQLMKHLGITTTDADLPMDGTTPAVIPVAQATEDARKTRVSYEQALELHGAEHPITKFARAQLDKELTKAGTTAQLRNLKQLSDQKLQISKHGDEEAMDQKRLQNWKSFSKKMLRKSIQDRHHLSSSPPCW